MEPTCMKSWAGNLLMWSDLTLIPLLQGQTMVHWLCCVVFPVDIICIGSNWDMKYQIWQPHFRSPKISNMDTDYVGDTKYDITPDTNHQPKR